MKKDKIALLQEGILKIHKTYLTEREVNDEFAQRIYGLRLTSGSSKKELFVATRDETTNLFLVTGVNTLGEVTQTKHYFFVNILECSTNNGLNLDCCSLEEQAELGYWIQRRAAEVDGQAFEEGGIPSFYRASLDLIPEQDTAASQEITGLHRLRD